ncbi:MAG: NTP transferase domain-containing protein [Gemmatimonadota bacterium]
MSTALVLAAGAGTRLRSRTPKPAARLLGLPLLGRVLFALQEAGITDAYVVLGHEADKVRGEIERIERLKIRVHWLYNPRWREPNGLSVLAAEKVLSEPFILTMSDHIFDPEVVVALRRNVRRLRGIDLAVDRRVDQPIDLEDATKVRLEADRIVAIGKSLTEYEAIDTGVFLASPALFEALRASCAEGRATLSGGVQRLADAGMARVTEIGGRAWHDVDSPADLREAERKLLASVRKPTDGPVARYLNRPLSTAVSRQVLKTPITPTQVSLATLLLGLVSAGAAAVGGYVPFLVSGILFQVGSILDGTDGEVAKLSFRTSRRGEWVDTLCDHIFYLAFLGGLTAGIYRSSLPSFYLWAGVLACVTAFVSLGNISFYLVRRNESGSALSVRYAFQEGDGLGSRITCMLQYLGKRDVMALLVLLLAVAGRLPVAVVLFGVLGTLVLLPATVRANLSTLRSLWEPHGSVDEAGEWPPRRGSRSSFTGSPGWVRVCGRSSPEGSSGELRVTAELAVGD